MYTTLPESSGPVLGYRIDGRMTDDEVAQIQSEMSAAMEEHGSLRVLVRLDGLGGVEPSAVWQDLKMTPDYVRGIERFAVVGDERWHDWAATLSGAVTDAEHFPPQDVDRAWAWLRGDDEAA